MTAPDVNADVRARFEASMRELWGDDFRPERDAHSPDEYLHAAEQMSWSAYRAAHADLAGEVRELAEEVIEAINDGDAQSARNAAQAALAKFHPTQPAGDSK